jgi:hypothetical protein
VNPPASFGIVYYMVVHCRTLLEWVNKSTGTTTPIAYIRSRDERYPDGVAVEPE